MKAFDADGVEIEVFSAEEHTAAMTGAVTEAVKKKEDELNPVIVKTTKDLEEARTALNTRAGEFAQFRKLSDEQVKKLDEKDRIIYENGLALQQEREKNGLAEKARLEGLVDSKIKSIAGTDVKLIAKMKDIWGLIGINAVTPEEIDNKVKMVLGAIGSTEPDLVASVNGFSGGSFQPPAAKPEAETSFAETERGKAGMKDLGLNIPEPKK